MSFFAPSAIWLLALIPPIVLLYFMKLRRQERRVPAGFLWTRALRQARSESFFERLRVNLLLILQILAVLLLTLALMRPFRTTAGTLPAHAILVLDRSASMQAAARFDRARAAALEMVREAPPGTSFMVISATTRARVETPFSDDRETIARVLRELRPLDTGTQLEPAMRLALSLSRQFGDAEIVVFSDQDPFTEELDALTKQQLERRMRLVNLGGTARNAAVTALEARRSAAGRFDVLSSVVNNSGEPIGGYLELHRGGKLVDARKVELPAGGRRDFVFTVDAVGDDVLEARLAVQDDLEIDNHAFTVLPHAAQTRILLVTKGNPFLEKALSLLPGARVFKADGARPGYALTVWDNVAPPDDLHGNHLLIHAGNFMGEERKGPFMLSPDAAHPIFRFVDLSAVHVASLRAMKIPPWGNVVARAADQPVVAVLERGDLRAVALGFDLFASDVPLSPAFPIFLSNVVTYLTGTGMAGAPAHVAAESPIALDFLRSGEPFKVSLPDGRTVEVADKAAGMTFSQTERQGVYTFTQKDRVYRVAVNVGSARESQLSEQAASGGRVPLGASLVTQPRVVEYWWLAAAAVLAVMMAEWWAFHLSGPHPRGRGGSGR